MKTIQLTRKSDNGTSTIGAISFNGLKLVTIEDTYRAKKIKDITRIPAGTYRITVRKYGGHHERYSQKFSFHKGMLQLANVPGYDDILIHIGNDAEDTSGCIIVATKVVNADFVKQSTDAYTLLYKEVIKEIEAGEEVYIKITDNPRVKVKKQVEAVKATVVKAKESYQKPTPSKFRKIGDTILQAGSTLSGIAVITGQSKWLTLASIALTFIGKTLTNFASK